MSAQLPDDLLDLEDLLVHRGWGTFIQHMQGEWGPGGARYTQAVQACANRPDDTLALRTLQQIIVAQKEIERLVSWPRERIKQLRAQTVAQLNAGTGSRRGPGL